MGKKQVKTKTIPNNQGWLFKSIVFLGMLLMTIGIFGALFTGQNILSGDKSETINFLWFFEIVKKYSIATTTMQSSYQTCSYISIGLFFLAIIAIILPILIMFFNNNINIKKAFAFASVGSLIYLFANTLFWSNSSSGQFMSESSTSGTIFGWGSILIIIGFVIGFIGLILHELLVSKTFISLRNIFAKIGLTLILFISIFSGFSVCGSYNYHGVFSFSISNKYSLFMNMGISEDEALAGIGMSSIIFSLASVVFLALTIYKFVYNNPKKKGDSVIVFSSLFWVTSFISNILALNYYKATDLGKGIIDIGGSVNLGSGAIVEIVLGLGVVVAAILTRIFKKTDKEIA